MENISNTETTQATTMREPAVNTLYFTITGTNHYYGEEIFEAGMPVRLVKDSDNDYDSEAIKVTVPGLDKVGYVANSPFTVQGESYSAGRLYDKIADEADGEVMYVLPNGVLCKIVDGEGVDGSDADKSLFFASVQVVFILFGRTIDIPVEPQEEPAKLPLSNLPVACGEPVSSQVEPDEVTPTHPAPKTAEISQRLGANGADLGDTAENTEDSKQDLKTDGVPVISQVETAEVTVSNLFEPHEVPVSSHLKADEADQVGGTCDKAPKTGESGEVAGIYEADVAPDTEPASLQSETAEVPVETQSVPYEEPASMQLKTDTADPPIIGLDGKTEDGAMPYELLKNQLEFLK